MPTEQLITKIVGGSNTSRQVDAELLGSRVAMDVSVIDSSGNIVSSFGQGLLAVDYNYISVTYPTTTTEVYTFKTGGSGGTTVATITVTYSDATKANITSVERT